MIKKSILILLVTIFTLTALTQSIIANNKPSLSTLNTVKTKSVTYLAKRYESPLFWHSVLLGTIGLMGLFGSICQLRGCPPATESELIFHALCKMMDEEDRKHAEKIEKNKGIGGILVSVLCCAFGFYIFNLDIKFVKS